ncbi:hypothetical protein J6590_046569, partial [Homalodisca vitripennis]
MCEGTFKRYWRPSYVGFLPTKPLCCHVVSWPYRTWTLGPLTVEEALKHNTKHSQFRH